MKALEQPVFPNANAVVRQIRTALAASSEADTAKIIPSIFISRPPSLESWKSPKIGPSAEWAIGWYCLHGFAAGRTRMNLRGYPSLLRELIYDEPDEPKSGPLRDYVLKKLGIAPTPFPPDVAEAVKQLRAQSARERQALADALGSDGLDTLVEAIFDYGEFTVAPGVPDIMVWLHTPTISCWFLSEVKAPGDSLHPSQTEWLARHWKFLRGHYLLTFLE